MSEWQESYIINLDENNSLLATQGTTYGKSFHHRGFYMSVCGCETLKKAEEYVLREINSRGWKVRERWWQFWRPNVRFSKLHPDA